MSVQPRILVVSNSYPNRYKCYAGMHVKRQVLLHRESGLNVIVLAPHSSQRNLVHSTWKYVVLSLQVLHAMLLGRFDLVHAHWVMPAGLLGSLLSRSRHKPFVITSHGAFVDDFESQPWLIRCLVRAILRSADVVIAVGQQHKSKVKAVARLPSERVPVISMGVVPCAASISRPEARRALGFPEEEKIVIFVGNLERVKGPDVLVMAASALLERGCQFRLVIGGQGPEKQRVLSMVDSRGLGDTTSVIGVIPPEDVFTWLSAADVCVVPSRAETFGLVAMEAMACGTAVVASDVGGLSENITDGETGFLFPPGDYICFDSMFCRKCYQMMNLERASPSKAVRLLLTTT